MNQFLSLAVDESSRGEEILDALGALAFVKLLVHLALGAQSLVLVEEEAGASRGQHNLRVERVVLPRQVAGL